MYTTIAYGCRPGVEKEPAAKVSPRNDSMIYDEVIFITCVGVARLQLLTCWTDSRHAPLTCADTPSLRGEVGHKTSKSCVKGDEDV